MDPRRTTTTTLLLALLALGSTGFGRCGSGWKVTWQDEFDGPAGQAPDPASWSADIGTDWGNAQLEFDTDRPENVALDGAGHLVITARKETYQGSAYTSARLLTKEKVVTRFGRVEARMKLPSGQGLWPAFWLLGANIDQVGWPTCGEIDVMEYRGQEPLVVHGTLHGPGYSGGNPITASTSLPGPAGFDQDFHVFAVEWDAGLVAFEVDGRVYAAVSREDLPAGTSWVFDQPFFVLLNLAVGGTYVGAPNAATTFPQQLVVDYVRISQRDP
ncbi:MAG: glycoside hydrolase family 16 protein [Anaeromyxobacter sp.]|nr:glycoside hydrolase family 16 protein [Anaeromyxobacter sp.]